MPNSASSKKRLRQNVVRRARNRSAKSAVRTQIRKVRNAIDAGDATLCATEFRMAVKELDQAAAKKIIHPNAAARTKSRLSKAVKAVGAN
jgi:small subunit ribosomal protein S20